MAFESLADKLQNVFKNLTGKGRLSEADVKAGHRVGIPGVYKVFHGTIKIQLAAVKSATAQPLATANCQISPVKH